MSSSEQGHHAQALRQRLATVRTLWIAMTTTTVVLAGLLVQMRPEVRYPPEQVFVLALAVVALGVAVVSFVLPRTVYRQALARAQFEVVDEPQVHGQASFRHVSSHRRFAEPAAAVQRAAVIFQTPFILAVAMSESVAMFGFVLGWLGAPLAVAGAFFAASWVLLLARFPTRARVFGPFEAHFRAKL